MIPKKYSKLLIILLIIVLVWFSYIKVQNYQDEKFLANLPEPSQNLEISLAEKKSCSSFSSENNMKSPWKKDSWVILSVLKIKFKTQTNLKDIKTVIKKSKSTLVCYDTDSDEYYIETKAKFYEELKKFKRIIKKENVIKSVEFISTPPVDFM